MRGRTLISVAAVGLFACGDNIVTEVPDPCEFSGFEVGDEGHPEPLSAAAGEARAGRLVASDLPPTTLGMAVWADGDYVVANDRVALVIEDIGASDLYDPHGGRPVGIAAVEDGRLVRPADFGEFFVLTGRYTVVTQSVSVINDGSDGRAAIVRAAGFMSPLPFFEAITGALLRDPFDGVFASIDYILEPDAEHVDIRMNYFTPRERGEVANVILHGFMYGKRMPIFEPGEGFGDGASQAPYLAFIDQDATSYTYEVPGEELGAGVAASGFSSNFSEGFELPGCELTSRDHARLTIGGPGLDGLVQAIARTRDESLRQISGVVRDANGNPAPGVRVHALTPEGDYLTRALSDVDGNYALHVPAASDVELTAFRRGETVIGPLAVDAATATLDIAIAPFGTVTVNITDADSGNALPARVQVFATGGTDNPNVPRSFGETRIVGGRTHVVFPTSGTVDLRLPVGDWEIVVSRGFEYELHRETVTIAADASVAVAAVLDRVVDTTGVMCADYHIHTVRSADGSRTPQEMASSAIADGLDIPVRSDHEFVADFEPVIAELGLQDFAFGVASVELTSMEIWGHMGVIAIEPIPGAVNQGTPIWQRFPTVEDPEVELETFNPADVMESVRQRPEGGDLIINHPIGGTNYFGFSELDADTGVPGNEEVWDESFPTIEAFNGSSFRENRDGSVRSWIGMQNSGRRVATVGSSDAHGLSGDPIGYPRTCLALGTDDPRSLTPQLVADATHGGRSVVSGGLFIRAQVNGAGPGETVSGAGATATLDFDVQAPSWIDIDEIEILVDGVTVETITVLPGDANAQNPTIRYEGTRTINVADAGSWVVVAASGDDKLEPLAPGREPFGVANPIYVQR